MSAPVTRLQLYPLAHTGWTTISAICKLLGEPHTSAIEHARAVCRLRARWTGEKRPPRSGEWYLSGAEVEAYCAAKDLGTPYLIAEIVLTEMRSTTTVVAVAREENEKNKAVRAKIRKLREKVARYNALLDELERSLVVGS